MRKKNLYFSIILLIIFSSCGYQVVDKKKLQTFNILEINTTGEKRINFKLKNKLLSYKKENSKELITLDINSKKTKSIKDKNIKNQITKYQIDLDVEVSYRKVNDGKENSFNVKQNGGVTNFKSYLTAVSTGTGQYTGSNGLSTLFSNNTLGVVYDLEDSDNDDTNAPYKPGSSTDRFDKWEYYYLYHVTNELKNLGFDNTGALGWPVIKDDG